VTDAPAPAGRWQDLSNELAQRAVAAGDPSGWFEELYSAGTAGAVDMPWDREAAHPLLQAWTHEAAAAGRNGRCAVVGCGLGEDAEHLAALGYRTTAFDISPTAVTVARERHPGTSVDYVVADLFQLPDEWRHAFDLVVDVFTVQALPRTERSRATRAVAELVGAGGTLVEIAWAADAAAAEAFPPWPLTAADLDRFTSFGLVEVRRERRLVDGEPRWLAEFARTTPSVTPE
jgi:SAM-dependent methyltransferase